MNLYPFVSEAILQTEISFAEYHAEITDAEKKLIIAENLCCSARMKLRRNK